MIKNMNFTFSLQQDLTLTSFSLHGLIPLSKLMAKLSFRWLVSIDFKLTTFFTQIFRKRNLSNLFFFVASCK